MRPIQSAGIAIVLVLLLFSSVQSKSPVLHSEALQTESGPTSYEILQFPLPSGSAQPLSITADNAGRLWFVEQTSDQIGVFNPVSKQFSEYSIPTKNSLPESIALDTAGNAWFTELGSNQLAELKNGTSAITEFPIPQVQQGPSCGPAGITPYQGTIWITCEFSNQVDEFFPNNNTFLAFNLPTPFSAPAQIVFDSKGNFWFTAPDVNMIGYVTVTQLRSGTTDGIREFAPSNPTYSTTIIDPQQPSGKIVSTLSSPSQIAISPDGSTLWISEHAVSSFDS